MPIPFQDAVLRAQAIEKNALPHSVYSAPVELTPGLELSPAGLEDLSAGDLINRYEKVQKVIRASQMEVFGAPAPARGRGAPSEAARMETESKMKALTTQAVQALERELELPERPIEPPKPEIIFEKEIPTTYPTAYPLSKAGKEAISKTPAGSDNPEFEKSVPASSASASREAEKPKPGRPATPIAAVAQVSAAITPAPGLRHPASGPLFPAPGSESGLPGSPSSVSGPQKPLSGTKPETSAAPPLDIPLLTRAETLPGEQKYEEIRASFAREWGGKVDEDSIKKKMINLTKELFREKSTQRRARIKTEITALKNMLQQLSAPRAARTGKDYSTPLWQALRESEVQELLALKDALSVQYAQSIGGIRSRFSASLAALAEDDREGRKQLYDQLVFDLTALRQKGSTQVREQAIALSRKHRAELERLQSSLKDAAARREVKALLETMAERYAHELAALDVMFQKNIENLLHQLGTRVLAAPEAVRVSPGPAVAEDPHRVIFQINESDEGTLLYYLHSRDPGLYKRYERKRLSKHEALFHARVLLAREKGLSADAIKKYLGSPEGESA